jgi:hypothetical protein
MNKENNFVCFYHLVVKQKNWKSYFINLQGYKLKLKFEIERVKCLHFA